MEKTLSGQVAWITGAASGIGKASAVALARTGATLVLTDRREPELKAAVDEIENEGGQAVVAAGSTDSPESVEVCATLMLERFGRCDILVNCAGINIPNRAWADVDPASFDEVVKIDLNGCFYTSRSVLPVMRKQGGGLMIHIASWAGRYVTEAQGPAYVAAKHGLVALSESLNQAECRNGIRSCCLCPGEVATPILEHRPAPISAEVRARMLQPEDLADLVRYVALMPNTVCLNEILVSPTWNRAYTG